MATANIMEGPLSKWTNVVKGWQYRWFVLDEARGLLSYYTSKEKMQRGSIRGCVRLKAARIGIDDEDDSTFTITVDDKTFHFQARHAEERENWINSLENAIMAHSKKMLVKPVYGAATFDAQLTETDAYLQLLIEQVQNIERRMELSEALEDQEKYIIMKTTAKEMIEAIKHCIIMLQISKESLKGSALNGVQLPEPYLVDTSQPGSNENSGDWCNNAVPEQNDTDTLNTKPPQSSRSPTASLATDTTAVDASNSATPSTTLTQADLSIAGMVPVIPEVSYSSSEDESFYDADEYKTESKSQYYSARTHISVEGNDGEVGDDVAACLSLTSCGSSMPEVIMSADDFYDELYDDKNEGQLDSLNNHGSLISHLISQVRIGMDLTKVVLPTFILERRSLLEMYADFLAHPDIFCSIADLPTPEERMIRVVKWYLSAFHAGRSNDVAKKPYNPILGETFSCCFKLPDTKPNSELATDGPVPWASKDSVAFIAEQVSHHPPISAFYAENYNKRISCNGYIWTKSKFLGLSIGVHLVGQSVISVLDYDEEYTLSFPNGYGRSILTVPWFELGGHVLINCSKSGYCANVTFHTKPFYGGKRHRVTADIFAPNDKKPLCSIEGTWNGSFTAKYSSGKTETFIDTTRTPVVKKIVKPRDQQTEFESRRLWQDVTLALKEKKETEATEHKHILEHRQRMEAKERAEKGQAWQTKNFHEVGEHWIYDQSLLTRLKPSPPQ